MATKKYSQVKELSKDELKTKIREMEKDIFQSRMQLVTGQLENTSSIWAKRKDVARMKMLLSQKAEAK